MPTFDTSFLKCAYIFHLDYGTAQLTMTVSIPDTRIGLQVLLRKD